MRILQVITKCELGGAQTIMANIANSLIEGNEVFVAAGEGDGKMWSLLDSSIECIRLKHLCREVNVKEDLLAYRELRKLNKRIKPDIVHLHSSKVAILGQPSCPSPYSWCVGSKSCSPCIPVHP